MVMNAETFYDKYASLLAMGTVSDIAYGVDSNNRQFIELEIVRNGTLYTVIIDKVNGADFRITAKLLE